MLAIFTSSAGHGVDYFMSQLVKTLFYAITVVMFAIVLKRWVMVVAYCSVLM
jgi:hypothetical protein